MVWRIGRTKVVASSDRHVEAGYLGVSCVMMTEEILSTNTAMYWSPGGRYLAYIKFNDTEVPMATYPLYGNGAYQEEKKIRYPKVACRAFTPGDV